MLLLAPLPEYPLSRAARPGAAGFFAAGRLAGGAGGVGLARSPPLAAGRAGGAGGAGGGAGFCTISSTYADGAHPEADLSSRLANHHPKCTSVAVCINTTVVTEYVPLPSFCVTSITSPFCRLSSPSDWPAKS